MKIPLSQIHLGPRQRLDAGDLTELKDSLAARGQIHSIGVRPIDGMVLKYQLIWGRRRFEAATALGWPDIEATIREGLSHLDEQLIEFEEDFVRKDRTWQELCLSIRTLNNLMSSRWKAGEIESWSSRALARITGYSNMSMNYMLRVAEALAVEPRDDAVWDSGGWTNSVKVLLERQLKPIDEEMARRRPAPVDVTGAVIVGEESPFLAGQVQELYPTPEKTTMWVFGKPFPYADPRARLELEDSASVILSYNAPVPVVFSDLRPGGYAIAWNSLSLSTIGLTPMPFTLAWNLINAPAKSLWPFADTQVVGYVFRRGEPTQEFDTPSGSVIAAIVDDDPTTLPPAVVDFCISKLATERMAVVLPCGVNPVYVAELGRVPIWFEPDPVRFQAKFDALKALYESQIPGVEVRLRE